MIEKDVSIDEDELMMIALEAGAEDINSEEEGFEIITDEVNFQAVCKTLEKENIKFASAEITMIPNTYSKLSAEDEKKMQKMLDMFDDNEDIQEVYHNWEE